MGHIINAKAMRVGWSIVWCDQWYSEIMYYTEYLHAIFRIRNYLIYIFTRRHFDKKAIFYSHFELVKHYKNLYVEIYFYSGKLESDYEDYKFDFSYKLYNIERNKDPETREPFFLYTSLKLVLIFDWLNFFYCKSLSLKDLKTFIIFLRNYDVKSIKKYFQKVTNSKYKFLYTSLNSHLKKNKPKLRIYKYFKKKSSNLDQILPNLKVLRSKSKKFFFKLRPGFFDRTINLLLKRKVKATRGKWGKNKEEVLLYVRKLKRMLRKRFVFSRRFIRNSFFITFKKLWKKKKFPLKKQLLKKKKYFKSIRKLKKIKNSFEHYFSKTDISLFALLFTAFMDARIYIGRSSVWKQPKRNITLRRFYMAAAAFKEMSRHTYNFASILSYTFQKLTKFYYILVNFFLVNNNCVNAKFLSRFIARKLKQNYPLKELLNPIRKELLYVIALSRMGSKSYYSLIKKKVLLNKSNNVFRKSLFKILLTSIFILYNRHYLFFFIKTKSWFSLELLIIFIWFNVNLKDTEELISISIDYFFNKCGYICFFDYRVSLKSVKNFFFPKLQPIYCFTQKKKFLGCFDVIFDYFYINKLSFFNFSSFDVFYRISFLYLRLLNLNYKRYLKFNYWFYQYKWVISELNMNHLKSRIKLHTRVNNLRGYKMHLRGRFRRKQRASSYWFSRGKVPLNSIDSYVDFAFFTIPLSNSAISVKVWLYKSDDILHNYFLKVY